MDVLALNTVKDEILREIAELEAKLTPLQDAMARRRRQLDALNEMLAIENGGTARDGVADGASLTDVSVDVLSESREPMHYADLLEALNARGVVVAGRQPGANLIAHLSRDARFARVGNGMYALAAWGMRAMPKRKRAKKRRRK